ncbi:DUF1127 domain-containing protein [Acidisoma sp.]|uniref:DUF1127 domain-containing protein n=1 Tax=Acidisoma sp. TaxID=1872115 RepID=UPI003B004E0D
MIEQVKSARPAYIDPVGDAMPVVGSVRRNVLKVLFQTLCNGIYLHWCRTQSRKELNAMSDAALRDIGLSRCQIDYLVR